MAIQLAEQQTQLLITARRQDRLESLAEQLASHGTRVSFVVGDIASPETRTRLVQTALAEFNGLDILINNAGVGAYGPFAAADEHRLRQLMEVNFFAPVELIRESLPVLREGRKPLIVNLGSVLGHFAVPNKSEYCASKFALHGFSDSLRCELTADKVDLLLVSPSTTSSEFFEHLVDPQGDPQISSLRMTPEAVARRIVSAMQAGRRELILSLGGKFLVGLDRIAPWLTSWLFTRFG